MSAGHNHAIPTTQNEKYLWIALGLTSLFLVIETVGSWITGSLALLSDAAHMITDASALIISLAAIRVGKKPADTKRTFGYYRFEILAAAFNCILLFAIAIYILYEAYDHLKNPPQIQSSGMLVIAGLGLIINLISMKLLSIGKDHSLNIKSAYLEVWSDMLGSLGVIIGALLIKFTAWTWVDPAIAIAIGLWVLPRTWILLKDTVNILLEGVPKEIDLKQLKASIYQIKGVVNIHELHVWAITSGKVSLTAHIVISGAENCNSILDEVRHLLSTKFGITHTTLQHEVRLCSTEELCNIGD